jgi:hypothetical protein
MQKRFSIRRYATCALKVDKVGRAIYQVQVMF